MGPSTWPVNVLGSRDQVLVGGNRFASSYQVDQRHRAGRKLPMNLVNECKIWLEKTWVVTLHHVHREGNQVADRVAWIALKLQKGEKKLWSTPQSIMGRNATATGYSLVNLAKESTQTLMCQR